MPDAPAATRPETPAGERDIPRILREMRAFAEEHGAYPDELEAYDEAIAALSTAERERNELKAQLAPCGECHLQPNERCDICGKVQNG